MMWALRKQVFHSFPRNILLINFLFYSISLFHKNALFERDRIYEHLESSRGGEKENQMEKREQNLRLAESIIERKTFVFKVFFLFLQENKWDVLARCVLRVSAVRKETARRRKVLQDEFKFHKIYFYINSKFCCSFSIKYLPAAANFFFFCSHTNLNISFPFLLLSMMIS